MLAVLDAIGQQVQNYSSGLGSVWYIIVFGFRLFVVSTIGGQVYGDEHSMFVCSDNTPGCSLQCFDQFNRMSHIRFWSFQIVAAMTPTVLFHLYVTYVESQIGKIEAAELALKNLDEHNESDDEIITKIERQVTLMRKKKAELGKYKMKSVVRGNSTVQIPSSRKIMIANIINLFFRLAIEVSFIVFGSTIFSIKLGKHTDDVSLSNYLWMKVPGFFKCEGTSRASKLACSAHLMSEGGYVPCHVARPFEKTFLLRYMNWMSVICVFLTGYEIVAVIVRTLRRRRQRLHEKKMTLATTNHNSPEEISMKTLASIPESSKSRRSLPSYRDHRVEAVDKVTNVRELPSSFDNDVKDVMKGERRRAAAPKEIRIKAKSSSGKDSLHRYNCRAQSRERR